MSPSRTEQKLQNLDNSIPTSNTSPATSHGEQTDNSGPSEGTGTPDTDSLYAESAVSDSGDAVDGGYDVGQPKPVESKGRRASTMLLSENTPDVKKLLGSLGPETRVAQKVCCGGGCCQVKALKQDAAAPIINPAEPPENETFKALNLNLTGLSYDSELSDIVSMPEKTVSFSNADKEAADEDLGPRDMPPDFVEPHAPYKVFRAPLRAARELTKPGAEKRTYHFDIDVTDYPDESGSVDFVVGGAIGMCPANSDEAVDDIFNCLGIPKAARDRKVILHTTGGRWPTIWAAEQPRELLTTRRELLRWCSDIQSNPPTKQLFRLLAEHATAPNEKKILTYLCSAQGQATFCDLRTSAYITLPQLLHAFPSTQPPLDHLLSVLNTLMPRFYSLSHDPTFSETQTAAGTRSRRCIEIAVTVHEHPDRVQGHRVGVGSGFLQRLAHQAIAANQTDKNANNANDLHIPIFRGLMANPLAKQFTNDGPMILIGAGVGVAPFRGFVQSRLKSANCANKVWVLQGIRDSLLDELYSGEWGVHEEQIKKVVQSRVGEGQYVQEEVRVQAELVWWVINQLDGKVYVCGSSKGMGEGVERALLDVAIKKGLNEDSAREFWRNKKEAGQYISETW